MKGKRVILRCYGNKALIGRVWEIEGETIYVLNEENYHKMEDGFKTPPPIGFPKNDVFLFNEESGDISKTGINWEDLTQLL